MIDTTSQPKVEHPPQVKDAYKEWLDFQESYGRAIFDKLDAIEAPDSIFVRLSMKPTDVCFSYGSPGIKVYRLGKMDESIRIEKMTADQRLAHEETIRKNSFK